MKNKLVICILFLFVLSSCNWTKPEKGKYIMRFTSNAGSTQEIEVDITQSRINHISMVANSWPTYANSVLHKKGKKVTGTFHYEYGSHAAAVETYELDGKIISENHRNTISGTYTGVHEYYGPPAPSTYSDKGTFLLSPR